MGQSDGYAGTAMGNIHFIIVRSLLFSLISLSPTRCPFIVFLFFSFPNPVLFALTSFTNVVIIPGFLLILLYGFSSGVRYLLLLLPLLPVYHPVISLFIIISLWLRVVCTSTVVLPAIEFLAQTLTNGQNWCKATFADSMIEVEL